MKLLCRLALIILLVLLLPGLGLARLHYQGETSLYEDTVWSGEVLIDGILTVAMGTMLEIRPWCVLPGLTAMPTRSANMKFSSRGACWLAAPPNSRSSSLPRRLLPGRETGGPST